MHVYSSQSIYINLFSVGDIHGDRSTGRRIHVANRLPGKEEELRRVAG